MLLVIKYPSPAIPTPFFTYETDRHRSSAPGTPAPPCSCPFSRPCCRPGSVWPEKPCPFWPKCSSSRKPARVYQAGMMFLSWVLVMCLAPSMCEPHSMCSWRGSQLKVALAARGETGHGTSRWSARSSARGKAARSTHSPLTVLSGEQTAGGTGCEGNPHGGPRRNRG